VIGRYFGNRSKAPLAIAGFLAIPLFFSSLMASTLALEKPHKIEWMRAGHIVATWHEPTSGNIARVWLWALVPSLLLVVAGLVAVRIPFGFLLACAAAIVIAMAVVHKTSTWERHHAQRFPNGVDLIPTSNAASDKYARGFWESEARKTALSLEHWTIGVSLFAAAAMGGLIVRRRFFARAPIPVGGAVESVHAPDATQPTVGDPAS
jgi:hypothetical protein